jgi:ADP-ribosylglycohydrolase
MQSISKKWRVSEHTNFTDAISSAISDGKKADSLACTFYAIEDAGPEVS